MENKNLKLKIGLTNIKRIITSILFINIMPIYNKVVLGVSNLTPTNKQLVITCYDAGPNQIVQEKNYFIILVPIAIAIILIIGIAIGIKKNKNKKMENENDKKD